MSDRWCCWDRMELVSYYSVSQASNGATGADPHAGTCSQGDSVLSPATHTPSWLCLLNFPPVKYLLEKEAWLNSGTRERCGIEARGRVSFQISVFCLTVVVIRTGCCLAWRNSVYNSTHVQNVWVPGFITYLCDTFTATSYLCEVMGSRRAPCAVIQDGGVSRGS